MDSVDGPSKCFISIFAYFRFLIGSVFWMNRWASIGQNTGAKVASSSSYTLDEETQTANRQNCSDGLMPWRPRLLPFMGLRAFGLHSPPLLWPCAKQPEYGSVSGIPWSNF